MERAYLALSVTMFMVLDDHVHTRPATMIILSVGHFRVLR